MSRILNIEITKAKEAFLKSINNKEEWSDLIDAMKMSMNLHTERLRTNLPYNYYDISGFDRSSEAVSSREMRIPIQFKSWTKWCFVDKVNLETPNHISAFPTNCSWGDLGRSRIDVFDKIPVKPEWVFNGQSEDTRNLHLSKNASPECGQSEAKSHSSSPTRAYTPPDNYKNARIDWVFKD